MTKKRVIVQDAEMGENLFRATMVVGSGVGITLEDQEFYPYAAINQLVLFGDTFFKEAKGLWEFSQQYGDALNMDSPNFQWKLSRVSGLMLSLYRCAMRMVLVGGEQIGVEYIVQFFLGKGSREPFSGSDALTSMVEEAIRRERDGGESMSRKELVSVLLYEVVKLKLPVNKV